MEEGQREGSHREGGQKTEAMIRLSKRTRSKRRWRRPRRSSRIREALS